MGQTILEQHEDLVVEIGETFLDNMQAELGKKYKKHDYEINPDLNAEQYNGLGKKYGLSLNDFAEIYTAFKRMKPSDHLEKAVSAFTASGGEIDIEPAYNESTESLDVKIAFTIKDRTLEKIEGLSAIESIILRMDAMHQIAGVLADADPESRPDFG